MHKDTILFNVKYILSIVLIALPFLINAQVILVKHAPANTLLFDNKNLKLIRKPIPDNLWAIDFSGLGTSVHYARKVGKGIFLGSEVGLLPDMYDWVLAGGEKTSQENTIWSQDKSEAKYNDLNQLLFFHLFTRWKPKLQWLEIEGGYRWALYDIHYYPLDGLWWDRFLGAYVKPTFGVRRVKVGFRLEAGVIRVYDYGRKNEFVSIISPVIRYNFN